MQDSKKLPLSILAGAVLALVVASMLMALWPGQPSSSPALAGPSLERRERAEHQDKHHHDDDEDEHEDGD